MRRHATARALTLAAVLGGLAAVCAGCSTGSGSGDDAPDAATTAPPDVYVSIGASETVGVGTDRPLVEAWPQVLYRTALDRNTVFVNLGVEGSTTADALVDQLPTALELQPTLATVWLNVNDITHGVPATAYERRVTALVRSLRRDGRTQVLIANTPPIDRLPAYRAIADSPVPPEDELRARVAAYNRVIERVADTEGAELVDLHAAGVEATTDGTLASLVADDGFHPSAEGHARIAELFSREL